MDFFRSFTFSSILCSTLTLTGCSDTNNQSDAKTDTRPTFTQFNATQAEQQALLFSTEEIHTSIQTANRAAMSFFSQQVDSQMASNLALTPWPMFGTLALADAASHGDTANEIHYELNRLELEQNWPVTNSALHQSQAELVSAGVSLITQDIWAEHDKQFETEFLQQLSTTFRTHYHDINFNLEGHLAAEVDHMAIGTFGENISLDLNNISSTRLFLLDQIKLVGLFDNDALQITPFEGLFENKNNELIRAPMIRVNGILDVYENGDLSAYRIPFASDKLKITMIQPKNGMHEYLVDNLEVILNTINNSWQRQSTQVVLPLLNSTNTYSGNWLSEWLNTSLLYSEELADLRSMDRKGGLYMQGMAWQNRLVISTQGIEIAGISGHAVSFSERNIYWQQPPLFSGETLGVIVTTDSPTFCSGVPEKPDLRSGVIIIQDTQSGLIQSVLQLNILEGITEGRSDCIYHEFVFSGASPAP